MGAIICIPGQAGQYAAYTAIVAQAGGIPRLCRTLPEAAACEGLLLPGGGDLEPWRYGQENTASRNLEPERDAAELSLLEHFTASGRPVLGICRGMQVLNVFFGGTLLQDLPGHSQWNGIDRLHRLRAVPSVLRDLLGDSPVVNSAHHQAVGRLGSGLQAVQWAPDGTVEAVVHQSLPVWGVQYHPERLAGSLPKSRASDGRRLLAAWLSLCR